MTGLKMKYFVLKPRGPRDDPYAVASRKALAAYALAIYPENRELADELNTWMANEATNAIYPDEKPMERPFET